VTRPSTYLLLSAAVCAAAAEPPVPTKLRGHDRPVSCVAFPPDGKRLVSGCAGGTLRLWDAADGEELLALTGHRRAASAVAFDPTGTGRDCSRECGPGAAASRPHPRPAGPLPHGGAF
jgi:WD40 repeat protein